MAKMGGRKKEGKSLPLTYITVKRRLAQGQQKLTYKTWAYQIMAMLSYRHSKSARALQRVRKSRHQWPTSHREIAGTLSILLREIIVWDAWLTKSNAAVAGALP